MTYKAPVAIPPGETIMELLGDKGIPIYRLAAALNKPESVTIGLLNGLVRIDREMALTLGEVLDAPASYWLNLEKTYNETLLRLWENQ